MSNAPFCATGLTSVEEYLLRKVEALEIVSQTLIKTIAEALPHCQPALNTILQNAAVGSDTAQELAACLYLKKAFPPPFDTEPEVALKLFERGNAATQRMATVINQYMPSFAGLPHPLSINPQALFGHINANTVGVPGEPISYSMLAEQLDTLEDGRTVFNGGLLHTENKPTLTYVILAGDGGESHYVVIAPYLAGSCILSMVPADQHYLRHRQGIYANVGVVEEALKAIFVKNRTARVRNLFKPRAAPEAQIATFRAEALAHTYRGNAVIIDVCDTAPTREPLYRAQVSTGSHQQLGRVVILNFEGMNPTDAAGKNAMAQVILAETYSEGAFISLNGQTVQTAFKDMPPVSQNILIDILTAFTTHKDASAPVPAPTKSKSTQVRTST